MQNCDCFHVFLPVVTAVVVVAAVAYHAAVGSAVGFASHNPYFHHYSQQYFEIPSLFLKKQKNKSITHHSLRNKKGNTDK